MSQATVVGPGNNRLVVTKENGQNWIESELLIASDYWLYLPDQR